MPTYVFKNKKTGKTSEEFMSISEMSQRLKEDSNLELLPSTFALVDAHRMGRIKPAESFREILTGIKRKYKGSTIEN